jgi:hypothetical protein
MALAAAYKFNKPMAITREAKIAATVHFVDPTQHLIQQYFETS